MTSQNGSTFGFGWPVRSVRHAPASLRTSRLSAVGKTRTYLTIPLNVRTSIRKPNLTQRRFAFVPPTMPKLVLARFRPAALACGPPPRQTFLPACIEETLRAQPAGSCAAPRPISARICWRSRSMGTSLPSTSRLQNCQPLQAGALWTWAGPSRTADAASTDGARSLEALRPEGHLSLASARKLRGDWPVADSKARVKALRLWKPANSAMRFTGRSDWPSSEAARCMRRSRNRVMGPLP